METVTVRRSSVAELSVAPNLADLVQAYADESALPDLGPATLDVSAYAGMEAAGVAHFLGAWRGERLVGFLILIATPVPHWRNQIIASTESFFVHPDERYGGAGAELRKLAESTAASLGARGLFISAPADGALARVLPRWGYRHSNSVFFKPLERAAPRIVAATPSSLDKVRALAEASRKLPQVEIDTQHQFHAGMYARTIRIPRDVVLTAALIKRATLLIVSGDVEVLAGDGLQRLTGYHVIDAPANRKQAYRALAETMVTMVFPTQASTVVQAEEEFTDEYDELLSRQQPNQQHVLALEN